MLGPLRSGRGAVYMSTEWRGMRYTVLYKATFIYVEHECICTYMFLPNITWLID